MHHHAELVAVRDFHRRVVETQTITSPGLWGIDGDSDDGYLDEVFADECDNLAALLQALGVAVTP